MKRVRDTRHGPVFLPDGVVFRLWAPTAEHVALILNGGHAVAMQKESDGWYTLKSEAAKSRDRYAFLINGETRVPDPASRSQPDGVLNESELLNPADFDWPDAGWDTPPWEDVVLYEVHVGTFTEDGTFKGVEDKLDYIKSLGVTALELMPLASFAGKRGWGYDGILPYAPHSAYGAPSALKHLVAEAHARGLMIFLDVVYNHFGPSGNFLNVYAKSFFTDAYQTPWGSAINMQGSRAVRDFFIDNAVYWLTEFNFDGLRFDAVHAIFDRPETHILKELPASVRQLCPGKHLIVENEKNEARYITYTKDVKPELFSAQWNDDIHHAFHVLLTGETDNYYEDYKDRPLQHLGRCLTEGFAYQGNPSPHRGGEPRGEPSEGLPPQAFVAFLQNHDQIGNRAMGERIASVAPREKLALASTIVCLGPQPPLIFMGEEWGCETPFLYFCDFEGELADQVREGRRSEFKSFAAFADPKLRSKIPDPNAEATYEASRLNWADLEKEPFDAHLAFTKWMLDLRRSQILPLIKTGWMSSGFEIQEDTTLKIEWRYKGGTLKLLANFSDHDASNPLHDDATHIWGPKGKLLPAWKSTWYIEATHD